MSKSPLWEVMHIAHIQTGTVRTGYAAEIRALRDWLVPDDQEPNEHLFDGDSNPQWDRWKERQRLRALLTAEADRAGRGEVEHG